MSGKWKYVISRDGETKKEFPNQETDIETFKYLRRAQSSSVHHALKFEGWKVEIIDQETGEKFGYPK